AATYVEGSFMALQAVVCAVVDIIAIHVGHVGEFALDTVNGRRYARITGVNETGKGEQKGARINGLATIILDEASFFFIPSLVHDLPVNACADLLPLVKRRRQAALTRDARGAIKGHPAHQPG